MGLEITGVEEHRLILSTPITELWSDEKNWLLIHNSVSKSREGGVGLLVKRQLAKSISGSKHILDSIISVFFTGNPRLVVTVV